MFSIALAPFEVAPMRTDPATLAVTWDRLVVWAVSIAAWRRRREQIGEMDRSSGLEFNQNARQFVEDLAGKKPQPADAGSQPVSGRCVNVGCPDRGLCPFGVAPEQTT